MVTLTADVTQEIRKMAVDLVDEGIYKSQSELVRDAIRQLAYKYGKLKASRTEARTILRRASRKSGESLRDAVQRVREE